MADHSSGELNLLNKKIDELLGRYNDLRIKNRELGKENDGLKLKILESEEKIRSLENKYERSKLSGALMGGGENAIEAKKKINELVREIDKCVALLNR